MFYNWTHMFYFEHMCSTCSVSEHMCSISEHMLNTYLCMCPISEHMCSIFQHMCSIFEHMCFIFEHMCPKTEHTRAELERGYAVSEHMCSVWSMCRRPLFVTASFSCSKADDGNFRQSFNGCDVWTYPCRPKWWTQPQSSLKRQVRVHPPVFF